MREWEVIVYPAEVEIARPYPFVIRANDRQDALHQAKADLVIFMRASDMLTNTALEDMLIAHVQSGGRYIYADVLDIHGKTTPQPDYSQGIEHQPLALLPVAWVREVGEWTTARELYTALAIKGYCGHHLGRALVIAGQSNERMTAQDVSRLQKYEGAVMASCCGGSGDALMAAKNALAGMMTQPVQPGQIRLEYIGDNIGAISFFGKKREYRGGNNDIERYIDADEDDVARLLSTGRWRVALAVASAPPVTETRTPEPDTVIETATPEPVAVAVDVSLPETVEVTAEDEAINRLVMESRKTAKKGRK